MTEQTLTSGELNRSTLTRQLLLDRAVLPGLQAQLSQPPYIGLWTRLRSFAHAELTQLLENRKRKAGTPTSPIVRESLAILTHPCKFAPYAAMASAFDTQCTPQKSIAGTACWP